jgi:peptidoglycan/LPS O-acetylase OafA/YrhL
MLAALTGFNQSGGWLSRGWWKVTWPTTEGLVWAAVITAYAPFSRRIPALLSVPLARIGMLSYSMYLLNFLLFNVVTRIFPYEPGPNPNLQSQIYTLWAVLPLMLATSAVSYYAIERPFLALRVRYLAPQKFTPPT